MGYSNKWYHQLPYYVNYQESFCLNMIPNSRDVFVQRIIWKPCLSVTLAALLEWAFSNYVWCLKPDLVFLRIVRLLKCHILFTSKKIDIIIIIIMDDILIIYTLRQSATCVAYIHIIFQATSKWVCVMVDLANR